MKNRETLSPAFVEQELSELDMDKLKLLEQAGNNFLDPPSDLLVDPDFCKKIDELFRTRVEEFFSGEDNNDLKDELLEHAEDIRGEFDIIFDQEALEERIKEGEIPPGKYSPEDLEDVIRESFKEDEDLELSRSEFRRLITAAYGISFFSLMGRIDHKVPLEPERFKGFVQKIVPEPNKNEKLNDFIEAIYLSYVQDNMRKLGSVSEANEYIKSLEGEIGEKFKEQMYSIESIIREDAVSAEDLQLFYEIEKDKYDKKSTAGEEGYRNYERYSLQSFIWRGCHRDDEKIQERARLLKGALPGLKGEVAQIVANSLFRKLTESESRHPVLKEIMQEQNETSVMIRKIVKETVTKSINDPWHARFLKANSHLLIGLFEGDERKEIEGEVGQIIIEELKKSFSSKEKFKGSLEKLKAAITDIDTLDSLSRDFFLEIKLPEFRAMAVNGFREVFQGSPLMERLNQTIDDAERGAARQLISDGLVCSNDLKQKIITNAEEKGVLTNVIPICFFLRRIEIEEKDINALLVFLENKDRVQFYADNKAIFDPYDYNKNRPDSVDGVLNFLRQWHENPDLVAMAGIFGEGKLMLSDFEDFNKTVDETGLKAGDLLDFIRSSLDVIKYTSSSLGNIKVASEWRKNPEAFKLAQTLSIKLGLKMSDQELESYTEYALDPEIKSQAFVDSVKEFAKRWPTTKLATLKKVYALDKDKKLNPTLDFLKEAEITMDAFRDCDDFLEISQNIASITEKTQSVREKSIRDIRFLKEHLSFYRQKDSQPSEAKEKPNKIEFNRLVREFDGLGLRLAIFDLEGWGIGDQERKKIFGAELMSAIEKIKKSTKATSLDGAIYNLVGRGEGADYSLRFHGTQSREIAQLISSHGQMIGHSSLTGSYGGNIDTAWGYCGGSGSVVCYTREDLRDSYINYGIESQCNAVDDEGRYTRIPSRIIYNMSADTKEGVLKKALEMYRIRKAIEEKPELVEKIKKNFETFLREQGEHFQSNIEAIYRQMRAHDYGEPKILEVADFYLLQIFAGEKNEAAQKRKIALEKILEAVRKDPIGKKTPDIAVIADCLTEYDELIPEPEGGLVKGERITSRKARLQRPLLFDWSVEKLSKMNTEQIEQIMQKRVVKMQIDATRKAIGDKNNNVINGLVDRVEKYISLKGLGWDDAEKLRKKVRGQKALFLGEMNGENLEDANRAVLKIRDDLDSFYRDIVKLASEKLEGRFADSEIYSRYKDRFELVLTGSAGRGDATLKSDLDCLIIFNDEGIPLEEKEVIAGFFNKEYKPALNSFLEEAGYHPDLGKAQQEESSVAFRSDLESLVIDPSAPVSTRLKIEPTNIIDLVSVSGDQKGLVAIFKKEFLERFSDVSQQEYLGKNLAQDISQKHMQEWYKGFSQLLSGDRIRNLKTELIRILDFNLFQSIAANLGRIKEVKGEDFIVPADNQAKISVLQEIGVFSDEQAEVLKQATIDLFRWRLRNEIVQSREMDPALLTNKERERATDYARVMNDLIESLVPERGIKITPVIS